MEQLLRELRTNGARITATRRSLLSIFVSAPTPLTVLELLNLLTKQKLNVNKTTVYRELEFLRERGMVHELQLSGEVMKRYELGSEEHHHHIVCEKCGAIADVNIPTELHELTRDIKKQTSFTLTDHAIEFVGVCRSCA